MAKIRAIRKDMARDGAMAQEMTPAKYVAAPAMRPRIAAPIRPSPDFWTKKGQSGKIEQQTQKGECRRKDGEEAKSDHDKAVPIKKLRDCACLLLLRASKILADSRVL